MTYQIITPPTEEPVSLDEAKRNMRLDDDFDATLVSHLIATAREYVEGATQRQLITATLQATLDRFPQSSRRWDSWSPAAGRIVLERLPVQSVSAVTYVDMAGVTQTVASPDYVLHANTPDAPAWIEPAHSTWWPTVREQSQAVSVTFIAGYGAAAAVPRIFKQAILLLVAHWHEHREPVVIGQNVSSIPTSAESLITQARWRVH